MSLCRHRSRTCRLQTCMKCRFVIVLHFSIDPESLWRKMSRCFAARLNCLTWTIGKDREDYFAGFLPTERCVAGRWLLPLLNLFLMEIKFSLPAYFLLLLTADPTAAKTAASLFKAFLVGRDPSNHDFSADDINLIQVACYIIPLTIMTDPHYLGCFLKYSSRSLHVIFSNYPSMYFFRDYGLSSGNYVFSLFSLVVFCVFFKGGYFLG